MVGFRVSFSHLSQPINCCVSFVSFNHVMPVTVRVENCVAFLHVHHSHSIVIYHRYDLDMTGPLVAQPQQPSTKAHPPPLTHAAHSKNAATAAVINLEIEGEIQMLLDYIDRQVVTFAKRFNKKKEYFYTHLHMTSTAEKQKCIINPYNAFLHAKSLKENQGACCTVYYT